MVCTKKEFLKKMTQRDWEYNLANFLFCQHVTPCTTTGKSRAELLMNHVVPEDLDRNFENLRTFQTDDQVHAKNYSSGKTWKPVTVVTRQAHCPIRYRQKTATVAQTHRPVENTLLQRKTHHSKIKLEKKQLKPYLRKIQQLSQHQEKKLWQRHHHLLVKVLDNRDRLREKEDPHNGSETTNVRGEGM
ncbi:hypothetical protein T08_16165 [Trichinella sp. T8]|nr:hypothetical protein T08_16165 [Trichinella sp. T8]